MVARVKPTPLTKLDSVTFDELLRDQAPFDASTPRIDLRGVAFVTASGLVQLAAVCFRLRACGKRPTILVENEAVRGYLVRAGFVAAIKPLADFIPPFSPSLVKNLQKRRGASDLLIELTSLSSGSELPDILDRIIHVLVSRLSYPRNAAYDVAIAVSEMGQNTFEHCSSQKSTGLLAMQVYNKSAKGQFLEIGLADYGDGIMTTLSRNPAIAVKNDVEAIMAAAKLGVSEYNDATRGHGLHHLLETAYDHAGTVQIRSGSGKVRFRMDNQRGWGFTVAPMVGTQISLSLGAKAG